MADELNVLEVYSETPPVPGADTGPQDDEATEEHTDADPVEAEEE